ncbi:MAG TPA: DUF92 domain-containing protein [Anaerolineales bacterium]|nr:DUF92 domain-containing protein [Anaerolineales bacterium]
MSIQVPLPLSLSLALLTALLAWRAGALTASGAAAAGVIGGLVLGLGGWGWAAGLLVFFVSSSALSRLLPGRRAAAKTGAAGRFEKGSRRDWVQAAANGGLGAALAVVQALAPEAAWPWVAFLGATAAANADTWATELGTLSLRPPRRITDGRIVPTGTSGAVSGLGLAAALGGAALVGSVALVTGDGGWVWAAAAAGGTAASLVDSWLGATVQAIYVCESDGQETEQHPLHNCGAATRQVRGWRWVNNDLVNLAASAAGAAIAVAFWAVKDLF